MNNNFKQDADAISSGWLNQIFTKALNNKSILPFSIFSRPISQLKKDFTLTAEFQREILGYAYLVAIYLSPSAYKRERLLYYHTDQYFRAIPSEDFACRLMCKMKLIAVDNKFDQTAEQYMGLSMGIINRPQLREHYAVKFLDEKIYYNMKVKFGYADGKELAHVIVFRPIEKDTCTDQIINA